MIAYSISDSDLGATEICFHSWYHYSVFCSLFRAMKLYPCLMFIHFLIPVSSNMLKYTFLSIFPKLSFTLIFSHTMFSFTFSVSAFLWKTKSSLNSLLTHIFPGNVIINLLETEIILYNKSAQPERLDPHLIIPHILFMCLTSNVYHTKNV